MVDAVEQIADGGAAMVMLGIEGADVVSAQPDRLVELHRLGTLIDLAHADAATTLAVCDQTCVPVASSHTGASAVQEFPRYEEARAIAATGGLIGLWPMGFRRLGMRGVDDFARHASYLAELVGPRHLCIGTDMNGIPGYAKGFDGPTGFPMLVEALLHTGFDTAEVTAILGGNAQRVLKEALPGA